MSDNDFLFHPLFPPFFVYPSPSFLPPNKTDFYKHYYSAACIDQVNRTRERANLLEDFRNHLVAQPASLSLDRFLPFANSSSSPFELSEPLSPMAYNGSFTSSASGEQQLYGSSSGGNWSDPYSGAAEYNHSMHSFLGSSALPANEHNATTLANMFWSSSTSGFYNLTTAALNLILADLSGTGDGVCRRETSLLFLLLMLGTVWMAVSLFNFNKT